MQLVQILWLFEPPHDKTNKVTVRPVWSESSLSAWRKFGSLATHWTHSEDSDQTGRMPRVIWVFAGRTVISLVLSWGGSFVEAETQHMQQSCLHANKMHLFKKIVWINKMKNMHRIMIENWLVITWASLPSAKWHANVVSCCNNGYNGNETKLRCRKTKFPTIKPTIYLPKCKF